MTEPISKDEGKKVRRWKSFSSHGSFWKQSKSWEKRYIPLPPQKMYFQYFMKYLKFQPVFFRLRWESGANLTRSVAVHGIGTDHSSAASLLLSRSARLPTWSTVLIWSSTSSLTSPVSANYLTERYYPREWYRSMSMNRSLKNIGYSSALGVGISPDLPHNFSASRSFCSQWFETQSSWSVGWCYPI